MLEVLCGSKNAAKILIFLFVNGKCYGSEVARLLKTPLTPVQKALQRLEKGGIIISYYEGKTRVYHFNPAFPLLKELEELLKKAYTLLPPHEKKISYSSKEMAATSTNKLHTLLAFWEKLSTISRLTFHAKTKSQDSSGWNGKGHGEVIMTRAKISEIIFTEKGSWKSPEGEEVSFSNVFRWSLDRNSNTISLEHLRRGVEHPVFLFHLTPATSHSLTSLDSHLCENDTYFGHIHFDQNLVRLQWRVIGPKKNEEIDYYYS